MPVSFEKLTSSAGRWKKMCCYVLKKGQKTRKNRKNIQNIGIKPKLLNQRILMREFIMPSCF